MHTFQLHLVAHYDMSVVKRDEAAVTSALQSWLAADSQRSWFQLDREPPHVSVYGLVQVKAQSPAGALVKAREQLRHSLLAAGADEPDRVEPAAAPRH